MNVKATASYARSTGYSARRTLNKHARTASTAAQVGIFAVTGFIAGFITCREAPDSAPKAKAKRK